MGLSISNLSVSESVSESRSSELEMLAHLKTSRTVQTVVFVGPQIRFIRTTESFMKDHLWFL